MNLNPDNKHCEKCGKDIFINIRKIDGKQRYRFSDYKNKRFCSRKCVWENNRTNFNEKEYRKIYYQKHKNEIKIKAENWYNSNREKAKIRDANYYLSNKEYINRQHSLYREKHKQRQKELAKIWYEKNKTRINDKSKIYKKSFTKDLRNSYVLYLIKKGTILIDKDIPQELVELKREQIKLRRLINENKNT